jgi:hypothetical protein
MQIKISTSILGQSLSHRCGREVTSSGDSISAVFKRDEVLKETEIGSAVSSRPAF